VWAKSLWISHHLAKNPIVGGNPAKLTIMVKRDTQYISRKMVTTFMLNRIASIIHDKLKIEDRLSTSNIVFLFIWVTLPIIEDITIDARITDLYAKIIKYNGAIFCQVMRSLAILHDDFFIKKKNHPWNGAPASFIKIAIEPPIKRILFIGLDSGKERYPTKIAEATDCKIKYFRETSVDVELVFNWLLLLIEQNESVLISNNIQRINHELDTKHRGGVNINERVIRGVEDMSLV